MIFFIEATTQYLLLDRITNNLELNKIINGNLEGDKIDCLKEKIKELVEEIFQELKGNINDSGGENSSKEASFVKALIRIFSILLNANISLGKKISKIIKQSAKLVLRLWPEQNSLLEGSSTMRTMKKR